MHRLYFSHSYDIEDLRFNESLWKLLREEGFHAWIDSGRESSSAGEGAIRPMDIAFNEWMMSQCDGFVAIAPSTPRKSAYQWLEYRTAVRMGLPRLVAEPEGGQFDASISERISFPKPWDKFWNEDTQCRLEERIKEFSALVKEHRAAGKVLQSAGRWRPRQNLSKQTVALLPPRTGDGEWQQLQSLLQANSDIECTLLQPSNLGNERALLNLEFDLLIVDVGSRGTPSEALSYIHATGIPQIRLCRVLNGGEIEELLQFIDPSRGRRPRLIYQNEAQHDPSAISLPRFLDGIKLDAKMQPVVFWTTPAEAAHQIFDTTGRILSFLNSLTGNGAETIGTGPSAQRYFEQYWKRAERGTVFISFAGSGGAAKLADRLARIFRFQNLRCFQYRNEDSTSGGRLESGEDIERGLRKRIDDADIVVYLIEENFAASAFCMEELAQGTKLRDQGLIELRAYSLDGLKARLPALAGTSIHNFRRPDWLQREVEEKIVSDVESSADSIGWALRHEQREQLEEWLKQDGRDNVERTLSLLRLAGIPEGEIKSIIGDDSAAAWLDPILRLPEDPEKHRRARQIVALLLITVAGRREERRKRVNDWLYERHLLQWPPFVAVANEDHRQIDSFLIDVSPDSTLDQMILMGRLIGQQLPDLLMSARPLCVTAVNKLMLLPVEWTCETEHDEPLAVRRPVRWRLHDVVTRSCIFQGIASNSNPPATLLLSLPSPDINPSGQVRRLRDALRSSYDQLGWPPELVVTYEGAGVDDVLSRLRGCQEQVVHIAGHMGDAGLQIRDEILSASVLAAALRKSDVRLLVLNGCEGGKPASPLALAYLTLADRLVRDACIPEVVGHRCKISESDAQSFGESFFAAFFSREDGFEPASAAVSGRKSGSKLLRYSPVVISQRELAGRHPNS
nr:TIR domain-containing protein [Bradyrhizobium sp. ORS 278]